MRRPITALVVLMGMAGTGLAAAPGASATTTCLVVDTNSDQSYTGPQALQTAVTAAASGDTLFVKGTCNGNVNISENLTISGQSSGGQKTATLNGQDSELNVTGATVTLNTLYIADDTGVYSNGTLTLNRSTVIGATARDGAGIFNDQGTLILNGSTVTGNTAFGRGGGIYNNQGAVTLNSSNVTGNTAGAGGGIYNASVVACGTVTLNNSTITGNTATDASGFEQGGGIFSVGPPDLLVNAIAPPAANPNVFGNTPDNIDILNVPCG